jgi:hypothetical protein
VVSIEEVDDDKEMEDSDDNEGSDEEGDTEADAKGEVNGAFDTLTDEEHEQLFDNTSAVCTILDKVWFCSYYLDHCCY